MGRLSFQQWGRQGGRVRSRRLSAHRRSVIAARAASARWTKSSDSPLFSVRLQNPIWEDPVYLEEVLSEGTLEAWRQLYRRLEDRPFGETAAALDKVLFEAPIYGATPLWQGILRGLRGGAS